MEKSPRNPVEGERLSYGDEVVLDLGKKLYAESLDTVTNYLKYMVTTAAGAIPSYIALIEFLGIPKPVLLTNAVLFLFPPALFILSSVLFSFGYAPRYEGISINSLSDIRDFRDKLIKERWKWSRIGTLVLLLGIAVGSYILIIPWEVPQP
jgi:hypothetical protein